MKLVSGIVDSGFFAQSALSAEVATKDSLGRNISETYLTGVDLTPYQTTAGMTAYQSAGDYLTTADSGNFYPSDNPSAFITGVDLTPYQLTADMTAYQPIGDYLTTSDSANFYTTANESGFLTAVPDTYLQNTDLSTEDGKVTAISGIPLSAGGDVPEGVMVESGLEYNAVQEISGYNGSAIAQYGAEKQWLVHDDTLVHASNSAQYALGVNLSAVAQLLGVDETVLWSGDVTGSAFRFELSEDFNNFKKLEFFGTTNKTPTAQYPMYGYVYTNDTTAINCCLTANDPYWYKTTVFELNNHVSASGIHMVQRQLVTTATGEYRQDFHVTKVIGIGRKQ